ncbi:hypothetical protein [Geoglobus ahangari]
MRVPWAGPSDFGRKTDEPISDPPAWAIGIIATLAILAAGTAFAWLNADTYYYAPCDTSYYTYSSNPALLAMVVVSVILMIVAALRESAKTAVLAASILAIAIILSTMSPAYACM